ncbi:MAG: hypothetical protein SWJ54_17885 [Cyanobacteriota bacterium]|nr:hypothetical protein [Cyanobacteriota bacterium]
MNIVQGYNPHRLLNNVTIHKVQGVLLIEKSGNNIYVYPDEMNLEFKRNIQLPVQYELKILLDSAELDGFYCINCVTHGVSYLGSEWDDVILGLRFRHLLASQPRT